MATQVTLNSGAVSSAGSLKLQTNGTTDAVTIDTAQNVGLGVTPSAWGSGWKALQVTTGNALYTNNGDRAALGNNAYYNGSAWTYATTGYASRYEQANGAHTWYNAPSSSGSITFTQAMTLDASGRLGIGSTSTPAAYQNINGYFQNGRSGWAYVVDDSANTHIVHNIIFNGTNNTFAGTGYASRMSIIDADGSFRWYQAGSGSSGGTASLSERARIDSSGNLLVGTTSGTSYRMQAIANGTNVALLKTDGVYAVIDYWQANTTGNNVFAQFYTEASATLRGTITYNRGAGQVAYNVTSDYRAKTVKGPVENALTKVSALKPSTGRMNDAEFDIDFFVAHELQEIVPAAVVGKKDAVKEDGTPDYQMVDKSALIPLLTAAIQEQQTLIQDQLALINSLTARVESLENK